MPFQPRSLPNEIYFVKISVFIGSYRNSVTNLHSAWAAIEIMFSQFLSFSNVMLKNCFKWLKRGQYDLCKNKNTFWCFVDGEISVIKNEIITTYETKCF